MSFTQPQLDLIASDPSLYLNQVMRGLGLDPDVSYLGQYVRRRGELLKPLYQFTTFGQENAQQQLPNLIQQYAQALMTPGANPLAAAGFSNPQATFNQFANASYGSPAFSVFHTGDPQADFESLASFRALQNANANSLYQQASQAQLQRQFNALMGGLAAGAQPANMTLLEYILGRPALTPPAGAAPGQTAPGYTQPGQPGQTPAPGQPAPGAPGTTPTTGGYLNVDNKNYFTGDMQQAANGWDAIKKLLYHPTNPGRMSFALPGVNYDPSKDFYRYYWGEQKYKNGVPQLGYSNLKRLIEWTEKALQMNPQANKLETFVQQVKRLQQWYAQHGLDWSQSGFTIMG